MFWEEMQLKLENKHMEMSFEQDHRRLLGLVPEDYGYTFHLFAAHQVP